MDSRFLLKMAAVLGIAAIVALLAAAVTALLHGSGSPQQPPAGPVQALRLSGPAGQIDWTSSDDPHDMVTGTSAVVGTGCFVFPDTDKKALGQGAPGLQDWVAQITGTAGGHRLRLELRVDGEPVPASDTHDLPDAAMDNSAILDVDGVSYPGIATDPSDAQPSYFVVEHGGTAGVVSIRFAADSSSPQAWLVSGSWRCGG